MTRYYRFMVLIIAVSLMATPIAWADHGKSRQCESGTCTAECCAPTEFKDPADVHWVHKRVSYGNYLKMAAAEVPVIAPSPAPVTFGPLFFDFKKTQLRPESVESCYQLIEFMKAHPTQTVLIDGSNAKMGARRTEIVKSFLMENGIDASRILITTDGTQPAASIHVRVGESPR